MPPAKRKPPLRLRDVQAVVGQALFRPLTTGYRMQRTWTDGASTAAVADAIIRPNDRLSSFERLEIYNRQYWFRLYDCFGDDFPGLRAALGEKRFHALATAYLRDCPSKSFTLRNLGQFLIDYLQQRPELTAPHTQMAQDLARFEWAQVLAFDSAARPPVTLADLASVPAGRLTLSLQPHISLLQLDHACDAYILAIRNRLLAAGDETVPTIRLRPRRERIYLAVHRHENSVYYKRLAPAGFRLLSALADGTALAEALVEAANASSEELSAGLIHDWFELWTALCWFCRHA